MPKLHSLPTSLGLVAVAAAVLVSASWADASVLCAHKNNKTGAITEGATPKLRAACKSSELPVDPASVGLQRTLGASNVVVRTGSTVTTNGSLSTLARCESGEVATGGGAVSIGNDAGAPFMRTSRPHPDTAGESPTGWRTAVVNTAGTGTMTVTAYVVCFAP